MTTKTAFKYRIPDEMGWAARDLKKAIELAKHPMRSIKKDDDTVWYSVDNITPHEIRLLIRVCSVTSSLIYIGLKLEAIKHDVNAKPITLQFSQDALNIIKETLDNAAENIDWVNTVTPLYLNEIFSWVNDDYDETVAAMQIADQLILKFAKAQPINGTV